MIIKKFEAGNEREAILKAKEDLGKDAIVMNIKTIKPKGLFKAFRKTLVEVTAAVDESTKKSAFHDAIDGKLRPEEKKEDSTVNIEAKLNSLAELLEKQMIAKETEDKKDVKSQEPVIEAKKDDSRVKLVVGEEESKKQIGEEEDKEADLKSKFHDLITEQLMNNEVTKEYAESLLKETLKVIHTRNLDDLLAGVYQKIMLKLGKIEPISLEASEKKPKIIFFIGPTGVGKTTTIAKLTSKYKLEHKYKIGIITADTYRIASVEQIKTYANILSIPVEVVYQPEDMKEELAKFKDYDIVFIDTAGRSHKNKEQNADLRMLYSSIKDYNQETYLVVSATTKYRDLLKITEAYSDMPEYRIIFTKLDETDAVGNILNLKLATERTLSYVSWGQNVPEDIGELDPQKIAKQLLGGGETYGSGR